MTLTYFNVLVFLGKHNIIFRICGIILLGFIFNFENLRKNYVEIEKYYENN